MPPTTLALLILLPLVLGAAGAVACARYGRRASAASLALITAASLALLAAHAPAVMDGEAVVAFWSWVPELGLSLAFRLDGLALLFCALILVIGLLVILYAYYYLAEDDLLGRFYGLLALFMAAMLGIVLADNLLLLSIFWELTSVVSFLLVGYWGHREQARQGARLALAVTGAGGLALLGGFLLLGDIGGTFEISALLGMREQVQADPRFPVALLLILVGAFTKSAQFPFHFWLPAAMAAPTPVSAYLHSATLVKAGVFLLARLYPVLGGNPLFEYVVSTVGILTLVFGAYVAVFKHDLKGLLAYSTISHLGLITFLIGLDSPLSSVAAVFHIGNHATFKASLFMAAGIIDHECGSRDMRKLNGLWHYMPYTATLAMVAAGAMAGVPLLNGFLSKEMFFAEALGLGYLGWLGAVMPFAATLAGVFSVCYSVRFTHGVFFGGRPVGLKRTPHETPRFMQLPVEILVVACIAVGVAPGWTIAPIVHRAAQDVVGAPLPPYSIALWHGFDLPFLMSLTAITGGALMYWLLQKKYNLHLHVPFAWTGRLLFQRSLATLFAASAWITARLANGSLQRYLALMIGTAIVLGMAALLPSGLEAGPRAAMPLDGAAIGVWAILVAAALGCVLAHHRRLMAVIFTGTVGLIAALLFLSFSAPDLALTQPVGRSGIDTSHADDARAAAAEDTARVEYRAQSARRRARRTRRCRHRGARLCGDDARPRQHRLVFPGEQRGQGRRRQHSQRHPRRLQGLRHVRRNHRAQHRRARCCGAQRRPAPRPPVYRVRWKTVAAATAPAASHDSRPIAAAARSARIDLHLPARP